MDVTSDTITNVVLVHNVVSQAVYNTRVRVTIFYFFRVTHPTTPQFGLQKEKTSRCSNHSSGVLT